LRFELKFIWIKGNKGLAVLGNKVNARSLMRRRIRCNNSELVVTDIIGNVLNPYLFLVLKKGKLTQEIIECHAARKRK
jgi:hypothetical protein